MTKETEHTLIMQNFIHRFYHCIDAGDVNDFKRERESLMADCPSMRGYFEKNWWLY
jgi:hypothetical protein